MIVKLKAEGLYWFSFSLTGDVFRLGIFNSTQTILISQFPKLSIISKMFFSYFLKLAFVFWKFSYELKFWYWIMLIWREIFYNVSRSFYILSVFLFYLLTIILFINLFIWLNLYIYRFNNPYLMKYFNEKNFNFGNISGVKIKL